MSTPGRSVTAKVHEDRAAGFDVNEVRQDFPILGGKGASLSSGIGGRPK